MVVFVDHNIRTSTEHVWSSAAADAAPTEPQRAANGDGFNDKGKVLNLD
jgi:hypothetical protein